MIHAGCKRRPNGPGSWVGAHFLFLFFFSSFCFLFFSFLFPPYVYQFTMLGWVASPSTSIRFFLRSFLFVSFSFLGIVECRPRSSGIRYMHNKKINIIYSFYSLYCDFLPPAIESDTSHKASTRSSHSGFGASGIRNKIQI